MTEYLEFNKPEDYVAHLREREISDVTLDIGTVSGEPSEHGFRAIAVYAVSTRRVSDPDGDYIAVWGQPIHSTSNFDLDTEKRGHPKQERSTAEIVEDRLGNVREWLEERGLRVSPGRWKTDPPDYLEA